MPCSSRIALLLARLAGAPADAAVSPLDGFAEIKRMYVRPALRGAGLPSPDVRLQAEALAAGDARCCCRRGCTRWRRSLLSASGLRVCEAFGAYLTMTPAALATSVFLGKPLAEAYARPPRAP